MAGLVWCKVIVIFIGLFWISHVRSEFEIALQPPEFFNKKTNDNLFTRCVVASRSSEDGEVVVKWLRITGSGTWEEVPEKGRVRSSLANRDMANGVDLIIMKAQKEDEGQYKCVGTLDREQDEQEILVSLYKKITFVDCPTTQHPTAGEEATVFCRVEADPKPDDITWLKNGVTINAENMDDRTDGFEFLEDGMSLRLPNYDPEFDDGTYEVQVMQRQSGDFETRQIQVAGQVAPNLINYPEEISRGFEGKSLNLHCSATGRPDPEYKWYKGEEETDEALLRTGDKYNVSTGIKGELVIADLNPEDEVTFMCVAENLVNKHSRSTTVDVFMKPKIEMIPNLTKSVDENVELPCTYSGDGEIMVQWVFRGTALGLPEDSEYPDPRIYTDWQENVLTLHIDSVTLADADEYQCEASNDAGEAVRRVFLSVNHAPMSYSSSEDVRATIMSEKTVFCEVTAVPKPSWTWMNPQGEEIQSGEKYQIVNSEDQLKSELTVTLSEEGDFGEYECMADNGVGEPMTEYIRVILVSPPVELYGMRSEERYPNVAKITIDSLYSTRSEGQEPTEIIFYYAKNEEVDQAEDVEQFWQNEASRAVMSYDARINTNEFELQNLTPETFYSIRTEAKNEAGASGLSAEILTYQTSEAKAPKAPVFITESDSRCEEVCELKWEEPDDQGADVTGFILEYFPVAKDGDDQFEAVGERHSLRLAGHIRSFKLQQLRPNTYYQVELSAENKIGQGELETIYMQTGDTVSGAGISAGAIVAIVIIIIIIVLVLVDVTCYYVNHCGVLMCLCVNLCNKTPPDAKQKEVVAHVEEGNNDKTPLNQTNGQEDKHFVETEETPLTDMQQNGKKDTTV